MDGSSQLWTTVANLGGFGLLTFLILNYLAKVYIPNQQKREDEERSRYNARIDAAWVEYKAENRALLKEFHEAVQSLKAGMDSINASLIEHGSRLRNVEDKVTHLSERNSRGESHR